MDWIYVAENRDHYHPASTRDKGSSGSIKYEGFIDQLNDY
jgi:hypothetical protein